MLLNNEFYHYAFLYGTNSINPFSFRVKICMTNSVDGHILKDAVAEAIKRYPYFAIKVDASNSELETIPNNAPIPIYEGNLAPCLGSEEANCHFLSISYQEHDLYIDVHHGLTDGIGLERFAKTLMYHYVTIRYGVDLDPAGVLTTDQPISEKEAGDPFAYAPPQFDEPLYSYNPEPAFDLAAENTDTANQSVTFFLKIHEQEFMNLSKSNDGSPNATVSALLYKAIQRQHPEEIKPIVAGIAYSLRDAYNVPESHGNLAGLVHVKYPQKAKTYDLNTLGTLARSMILLQTQPENTLSANSGKQQIVQYLKSVPSHEKRTEIYASMMRRAVGLDTFALSYIGKQDWHIFEDYVDTYYTLVPLLTCPVTVELNAINGWFNMAITQSFSSDRYLRSFLQILEEYGITYVYEGCQSLVVPNVKIF